MKYFNNFILFIVVFLVHISIASASEIIDVNSRTEVFSLNLPHDSRVKINSNVYTHIVDTEKGLDFWTDNPEGDGQINATEIFTKGTRKNLPIVTHGIVALTKELGNYDRYTKGGIKYLEDENFYQWYYVEDSDISEFKLIDKDSIKHLLSPGSIYSYNRITDFIYSSGNMYISYKDKMNNGLMTYKKYDNNEWQEIESSGMPSKKSF